MLYLKLFQKFDGYPEYHPKILTESGLEFGLRDTPILLSISLSLFATYPLRWRLPDPIQYTLYCVSNLVLLDFGSGFASRVNHPEALYL